MRGAGRTAMAVAGDVGHEEQCGSLIHRATTVRVVELALVRDPGEILPSIARAFGVRPTGSRPLAERVRTALANCSVLLLLDNFEHVLGGGPDIAPLVSGTSQVRFLITSREPLHLQAEHVFNYRRCPSLAERGHAYPARGSDAGTRHRAANQVGP